MCNRTEYNIGRSPFYNNNPDSPDVNCLLLMAQIHPKNKAALPRLLLLMNIHVGNVHLSNRLAAVVCLHPIPGLLTTGQ